MTRQLGCHDMWNIVIWHDTLESNLKQKEDLQDFNYGLINHMCEIGLR